MISIKSKQIIFSALLFFISFSLLPSTTSAQEDSRFVTCSGPDCTPCDLVDMGANIVQFLVVILTIVASLVFAYAGFVLTASGGDVTAKERAKTIFANVFVSYIIVLSAWLIIDTGMKALLDEDVEARYGLWNEIQCATQPSVQNRTSDIDDSEVFTTEQGLTVLDPESRRASRGGSDSLDSSGGGRTDDERSSLADQIISNGDDTFGTTELMINGQCMEVMNDNPTLSDGTYVPFTQSEAVRMADQWGWQLPTRDQALAIRRYAEQQGNVYPGITRSNNSETDRQGSIDGLMNDPEMAERARQGKSKLINGHFKWYVQEGGRVKIMGLSKGNGKYWQPLSGAHSSDSSYVDYSHGVRLVRPCQ